MERVLPREVRPAPGSGASRLCKSHGARGRVSGPGKVPGESLERCRVQGGGPALGKERQVHPLGGEGRGGEGLQEHWVQRASHTSTIVGMSDWLRARSSWPGGHQPGCSWGHPPASGGKGSLRWDTKPSPPPDDVPAPEPPWDLAEAVLSQDPSPHSPPVALGQEEDPTPRVSIGPSFQAEGAADAPPPTL